MLFRGLVLVVSKVVLSSGDESWPVRCSKDCQSAGNCNDVCSGDSEQVQVCPFQGECANELSLCPAGSQPSPCRFSDWSSWSSPIGCTGLCTRSRTILQHNRCGGPACEGPLHDAMICPNPCPQKPQDCVLGEWGNWTDCGVQVPNQRTRSRLLTIPPARGGKACHDPLEETEACGDALLPSTHDCQLSAWLPWSTCTKTCGGGQHGRIRTISVYASRGGRLCSGSIGELQDCGLGPCSSGREGAFSDCKLSDWSQWSTCTAAKHSERTRKVVTPASGDGKACTGATKELRGCELSTVSQTVNCTLSDWSDWELCDRSCGGGQTSRKRSIATAASGGGKPCAGGLQEATSCNYQACSLSIQPCRATAWSEWGSCSTSCGPGNQVRRRSYIEAAAGGLGCTLALSESRGCEASRSACNITDCKLSDWSDWVACSKTCIGGMTQRHRSIIQHASVGGKECADGSQLEVQPCGAGDCDARANCEDGEWGPWEGWTECTKSCEGGIRWTTRRIVKEANACGKPAIGLATQPQSCNDGIPCAGAIDCELTDWSQWSSCQHPCSGVRERSRQIKVHAANGGKACGSSTEGTSLVDTEHCPAAEGSSCIIAKQDGCIIGEWSNWTECSQSCGGGQISRIRQVLPGADGTVAPCSAMTKELKACATTSCGTKVDCKYGDWSEWGNCTKCGGQQFRSRQILQNAKFGGVECSAEAAAETKPCNRDCGEKLYYCVWSDWSAYSDCTASCGIGIHFRKRLLSLTDVKPKDPVAVASSQKECDGQLLDVVQCPTLPACDICAPKDCNLEEWSEWSSPSCEGLCTRTRGIARAANECGKPCTGSLSSTKPCSADCVSKDCKLSNWSPWTTCSSNLDNKYQWRNITQLPQYNGQGCEGAVLNQTAACLLGALEPVDCALSEWTLWSACDRTCGAGQAKRSRSVVRPASNGGQACHGSLAMTAPCNAGSCSSSLASTLLDCQLGPWSLWSPCDDVEGQQERQREILHMAKETGEPCNGQLKETQGCGSGLVGARNCMFSTWSDWTTCPVSCGGSQQQRARVIEAHARGGGLQCEGTMLETMPCGEATCPNSLPTVCLTSDWSEWGACSQSCGEGYKGRSRKISQPAITGAVGCQGALSEVTGCHTSCNSTIDCVWGEWNVWSSCVPAPGTCGTGYKSRARKIQRFPELGGQLCEPRHMEEVMPVVNCQGQPECCIDGQWGDWKDWSSCTATCGSGTKKRSRDIKAKETSCGRPAPGSPVEYAGCSHTPCIADVDCKFGDWSAFSVCSDECHGQQTRTREITTVGTGIGKPCAGAISETIRCNPSDNQTVPISAKCGVSGNRGSQDCVMSDWSDWSDCSATCERGYSLRLRHVEVQPNKEGKSCPPSTKEIKSCHKGVTCFPERVDCVWEAWTVWSACDAYGKISRTRGIAKHAAKGGLECSGDFHDIKGCDDNSTTCSLSWYNCSWGVWSAWSGCSKTCGRGAVRTRSRKLQVSTLTIPEPVKPTIDTYSDNWQRFDNSDPYGYDSNNPYGAYSNADSGYSYLDSFQSSSLLGRNEVTDLPQASERTHAEEFQLAFALGGASLLVLGVLVRSIRSQSADFELPRYGAVPQQL